MLYLRGTWSLSAANPQTTQKNWDRAFLTEEQFMALYGKDSYYEAHNHPLTHKDHDGTHKDCIECQNPSNPE